MVFCRLRILPIVTGAMVICLALACQRETPTSAPNDWKQVNREEFTLHLPPTFREIPVQGVDTKVWQFEDPKISLHVESGIYANVPEMLRTGRTFKEQSRTVNGRNATYFEYGDIEEVYHGKYVAGLYFQTSIFSRTGLLFLVKYVESSDRQKIISILESVEVN